MSFNRENVTWQSANGTWSRGFFRVIDTGDWGSVDYDPEWDVDYDMSHFDWVSTGHPDEWSAHESWDGANPGGGQSLPYDPADSAATSRFDEMAAARKAASRQVSSEVAEMQVVRLIQHAPPSGRGGQSRQPAGVPVGGQFAAKSNPESDLDLT